MKTSTLNSLDFALALFGFTTDAAAQGRFANVQIKATQVAGSVHMLEGAGGNIGVSVGKDGLLIVDNQFAPLAEKVEAALGKLDKGPINYVLNTHWHGDHTGGNAHFGKKATIVAHANVRKRLAAKSGTAPSALPVVTYRHPITIHFNGEDINIYPQKPGHTDGDSIVHFTQSKVIHMGDQFFNERFPFIDLGSGGDVEGYMATVKWVLDQLEDGTRIIPGHGKLASEKDLRQFYAMLQETTGNVWKAIAAGQSLDEIKEAGVPDKYKSWGEGFINTSRWLTILYNDLSK